MKRRRTIIAVCFLMTYFASQNSLSLASSDESVNFVAKKHKIKTWSKILIRRGETYGVKIIQATDGGFVIAGTSSTLNVTVGCKQDCPDAWIAKLDDGGNTIWERFYGGRGIDLASDIVETRDGGFAISGIWGNSVVNFDMKWIPGQPFPLNYFIMKLDSDGWNEWLRKLNFGYIFIDGDNINLDGNRGFIASAETNRLKNDFETYSDIGIIRILKNGDGESLDSFDYGDEDMAGPVFMMDDGSYVFAGKPRYGNKIFVTRAEPGGKTIWKTELLMNSNDKNRIKFVRTANVFFAADYDTDTDSLSIYEIDDSGEILWDRKLQHDFLDVFDMAATADGGAVLAGKVETPCESKKYFESDAAEWRYLFTQQQECTGAWIMKFDRLGGKQWEKVYGKKTQADARSIAQTSDGGYVVAGSIHNNDTSYPDECYMYGCSDAWILKLDENGDCHHCF